MREAYMQQLFSHYLKLSRDDTSCVRISDATSIRPVLRPLPVRYSYNSGALVATAHVCSLFILPKYPILLVGCPYRFFLDQLPRFSHIFTQISADFFVVYEFHNS